MWCDVLWLWFWISKSRKGQIYVTTPACSMQSLNWAKAIFGPLGELQLQLWTDILVFLTGWWDQSAKVQRQMLWYWGFCGLCGIYITEAFCYTKTFTSNEAGMPQRRNKCQGDCGDSTYPPVYQSLLPYSCLLGDICSLTIMGFISACVASCCPDSCTRVRSLACISLWNEWTIDSFDSWHMLPGVDCIYHAVSQQLKNRSELLKKYYI